MSGVFPHKIDSTYGVLDVMKHRKKLEAHLKKHGPAHVLIEATITDAFGSDDGTSIEFNMDVTGVTQRPDTQEVG